MLDGYTGFTPVQNRLLGELLTICRDVIVTVTIDGRENPYAWDHPYQLFAMSKDGHIAGGDRPGAPCAGEELKFLRPQVPPRFQESPALAFVENHLFRYGIWSLRVSRTVWRSMWQLARTRRRRQRPEGARPCAREGVPVPGDRRDRQRYGSLWQLSQKGLCPL